MYYYEHYGGHVEAQNARNEKTRHIARNRTVEDLLKNNKTCPEESIYPVSYTHLDVYKRQIFTRTQSGPMLCLSAETEAAHRDMLMCEERRKVSGRYWAISVPKATPSTFIPKKQTRLRLAMMLTMFCVMAMYLSLIHIFQFR